MLADNIFLVFLGKTGALPEFLNYTQQRLELKKANLYTTKNKNELNTPNINEFIFLEMERNVALYEFPNRVFENIGRNYTEFLLEKDIDRSDFTTIEPKNITQFKKRYCGHKNIYFIYIKEDDYYLFKRTVKLKGVFIALLNLIKDYLIYKNINKKVDYVIKNCDGVNKKFDKLMKILNIIQTNQRNKNRLL